MHEYMEAKHAAEPMIYMREHQSCTFKYKINAGKSLQKGCAIKNLSSSGGGGEKVKN